MTTSKISQQINAIARKAKTNGNTIEINYQLPYVAVNTGDNKYFFQGEEASELIEDARKSDLHYHCSIENIILWEAQGW